MKLFFENKKLAFSSDKELAKYIADNYKIITGYTLRSIFNKDQDGPIFDQDIIDKTSDKIHDFLKKNTDKSERDIEEFYYYLDDYLASIY